MEGRIRSFLTWALYVGECSASRPAKERPVRTKQENGYVPKSMDTLESKEISHPCRELNNESSVGRLAT